MRSEKIVKIEKMVWKILVMSADLVIFAKLLARHSVAVGLPAIAGD